MEVIFGTACLSASVIGVKEPPKAQEPEGEMHSCLKPAMDAYIPREKEEPSGRYWVGKDENGQSRIYFDDPGQMAKPLEKLDDVSGTNRLKQNGEEASAEQSANNKKGESCTSDTSKVDREIEKLKEMQKELEQQLNFETDAAKIKDLEKKLVQVEHQLRQKDNDTYRRQHTTFA
ncbi:MAG: hypothetical protein HFE73_00705 [Firmicutes bacterium]|nr:hypothetical protein [Bacillota bacterium]